MVYNSYIIIGDSDWAYPKVIEELLLVTIILAPHHLDGEWQCGQCECGIVGLTLQVIGGFVSFFSPNGVAISRDIAN